MGKRTPAQRLDIVRQSKNITIARLTAELVILREALEAAEAVVYAASMSTDSGRIGAEAEESLRGILRALEQTPAAREALRKFRAEQRPRRAAQVREGVAQ